MLLRPPIEVSATPFGNILLAVNVDLIRNQRAEAERNGVFPGKVRYLLRFEEFEAVRFGNAYWLHV
jgi:hypothetical protein